jgi:cold shock CspA family protein
LCHSSTSFVASFLTMAFTGTVKNFGPDKGFGFILNPAGEGMDIFVHIKACTDGMVPQQGDVVRFDVEESKTKPGQMVAANVSGGTGMPKDKSDRTPGSMWGAVKNFNPEKGFGFIIGPDGNDIFLHLNAMIDGTIPQAGDNLQYDLEPSKSRPGQMQACKVAGGTGTKGQGKSSKGKGKDGGGDSWGGDSWGGNSWNGKDGGFGAAKGDSWGAGGASGPYGDAGKGGGGKGEMAQMMEMMTQMGMWGGDNWGAAAGVPAAGACGGAPAAGCAPTWGADGGAAAGGCAPAAGGATWGAPAASPPAQTWGVPAAGGDSWAVGGDAGCAGKGDSWGAGGDAGKGASWSPGADGGCGAW